MENWNEKLITAANRGDVEALKLCLQNDADIDYQTGRGLTALMWAARGGHLEVTQLLLEKGCQKETTTDDGSTALHFAAQYGYLQVTRCLAEEGGISPFVKTNRRGKTPYDLAAARLENDPSNKEVMEYLQSLMSKDGQDVSQNTSGKIQEIQTVEDQVPTEIKLMTDKRSVELYLKLLESGSEKKRDIRLVIVGKKGAGKTSLIKRLFGEDSTDVTSTNGIEIHKIKCKAKSDDGIWNKLDRNYEETETHARLLKEYEEKLHDKGTKEEPIESHIAIKENTPATSFDESKKSGTVQYQQPEMIKSREATKHQTEPPVTTQQPNQSFEQAERDFETMIYAESVDLHDKEEYATLLLWDFAGDEEFYHTHQTFLSPDAIYFVVTKLNEADDPNAQDLFRLWMDSIHCYSRLEEDKTNSDENKRMSDDIDPPVVIVGTWKDAVIAEPEELEEACRKNLLKFAENLSEDERGHVRCEYLISNKDDDHSVFQQIRQDIVNLARKMKTWNKDYPLKFIQLEKILQEKKKELPIISYHEIKRISTDTPMPLNEKELSLFLEFHHEIRALVYFKDLPDYIILDTQWLSDAFKCIVTAKKFRAINIRNQKRWEEFYNRGKLHNEVIEDIFRNETNILNQHKDYILKVMEKYDIIIRPTISDTNAADKKPRYYVPCLIKDKHECDIYKMFNVAEGICNKSTWLCFKFRFLPPHLINHLIAALSRTYEVAEVASKQKKRQIALFKGFAVFELQKTSKLRKLLVMKCPNAIHIQVWQFGKQIEGGFYKYMADFVTEEIIKIISTRFKMSNVKFEKKWECGQTKPESVTGSYDFSEDQDSIYYCETCTTIHEFIGEWSDLQQVQSRGPYLSESSEDVLRSNPCTKSSSKIQTTATSTKVRVHVQAGKRVFSNVNEKAPGTASSAVFTKEEINFTKMGMIVLNILADALYDLLKQDKPNLRPRNDCDITYLYSEHRKLSKHIPSNSSHRRCPPGPWGGNWQDIQNTDIAIGDDIERIRLTRNELQHSQIFKLEDKRFTELSNIISDLLRRFNQHNKPTRLYIDVLNEILVKTISEQEVKSIENEILGMTIEVEIEH
ncbi:death-associated protein kinase 1-like [Mytilus californianus]|uniref:death-associated protein kinase 1-like n=1 Tax=Mytilus californianus TaxID=6549 RepID=UPI00224563DA|nr:death-associated protein kinase 1-like [Mytilus californianus]